MEDCSLLGCLSKGETALLFVLSFTHRIGTGHERAGEGARGERRGELQRTAAKSERRRRTTMRRRQGGSESERGRVVRQTGDVIQPLRSPLRSLSRLSRPAVAFAWAGWSPALVRCRDGAWPSASQARARGRTRARRVCRAFQPTVSWAWARLSFLLSL